MLRYDLASMDMNRLMVVVPVEGLAPELCKVSIGSEDTKQSVIGKVRTQLCSKLKQRLDHSHDRIFHIPNCSLWGDVTDIDCSVYDSVINNDALPINLNREGFTLLFQTTSKQQSSKSAMKENDRLKHNSTSLVLNKYKHYSNNFDMTLDQPVRIDYNLRHLYGIHNGSTQQSRAVQAEHNPEPLEVYEVIVVSETDGEEEQGEDSPSNPCMLSGLHKLASSKQKLLLESQISRDESSWKQKHELCSSSEIVVSGDEDVRQTGSTAGGIYLSMTEAHGAGEYYDDGLKDEGIVLEGQWEEPLDMSDTIESDGVRGDGVESGSVCSDNVESEGVRDNDVMSDDVMIVSVESDDGLVCDSKQQLSTTTTRQLNQSNTYTANCCNIDLTKTDLGTLQPYCWLNDQVINSYMRLLVATYGHEHKVHIMNTFFYSKLCKTGYKGVERWLKKVNLKKLRLLLVPVHLGAHWCLAVINLNRKRIQYFDSLGGTNSSCLKKLRMFMNECGLNGKLRSTAMCWRLSHAKNIPRQSNSGDCGVFVCQFARWLCSDSLHHSRIPFRQKHMLHIRTNMLKELRTGRLREQVF